MIAFISCVKTKQNHPCKAQEMYISDLFKKSLKYAKQHADKIYILSAKYGLLKLDEIICPYEKTLNGLSEYEKKKWAYKVFKQFIDGGGNNNEPCMFICGKNYRKYLMQKFPNAKAPLKDLSFGNQLKWLKEHT